MNRRGRVSARLWEYAWRNLDRLATAGTLIPRPIVAWTFATALLLGITQAQVLPPTREELMEMRRLEIGAKRVSLERQRLTKLIRSSAAQIDYNVSHYLIELEIDTVEKQISGVVTMTAKAGISDFAAVELDLDSSMTVDSVGGDASSYYHSGNLLQVELAQPVQNDTLFTVQVAYHGRPVRSGFGSFGFDYHGEDPIIWSLSEPYFARTWWPCKDTPGDKADSVDMIVTVPDNLIAASNGTLLGTTENGDGRHTFHWHEGYPITTYLVSLAITNYEIFSDRFHYAPDDSMIVSLYAYPDILEAPQDQLDELLDMLAYFHVIFGPYPFITEKYGIAQFPWGGGMEHQTITSQGTFLNSILTVHELAHQWWGDKITNATWHEIWLNEGFASYAEALYFEHVYGEEYFHGYMESMMYYHHQQGVYYPYPIYVDDTTSVGRIFDWTVYDKGAWFLHMLRHVVGDSTFFDILLAYSDDPRFAYGNATTAGFQDVCETVSGRDLDWFFQPWIYEVGRPEYRVEWCAGDTMGTPVLNLLIEQTQVPGGALFPMPIDITVETEQGDTVVTVFNNLPDQNFVIGLTSIPIGINVDKDGWILKKIVSISAVDDRGIIPTTFALYQNYPNPFNPSTQIEYDVLWASKIRLAIYDLLGREVATLVNDTMEPGQHVATWNGQDYEGTPVASGIYLYRIEMSEPGSGSRIRFSQTRKMVLLR